jgi:hypothetical protein
MLYTHLTPSALRVSLSIHSIPVPNRTVHLMLLLYTCTRVEVVHPATLGTHTTVPHKRDAGTIAEGLHRALREAIGDTGASDILWG